MESYGPTYIACTKLWAQHLVNRFTVGRLHAELSGERLAARTQTAGAVPALTDSILGTPHALAPAAWRGASVGAACNPLSKADFLTGTGRANALQRPELPWASMLAWNARGHAARMQYVLADARVVNSDYTERGLMGELVEGVYTTTAMSCFAPGYATGGLVGGVVSGVLAAAGWASGRLFGTAWRGPKILKGADTCGNLVGVILGLGAGCLAVAGPYAVLVAARMPTLPVKGLCAALGCLTATLVNCTSWLHHHVRAAWRPTPVIG